MVRRREDRRAPVDDEGTGVLAAELWVSGDMVDAIEAVGVDGLEKL